MNLKEQSILFFSRDMSMGGTSNVLLQLCEILQPSVHKIVVCSIGGVMTENLKDMGIKHYKIPDVCKKTPINAIHVIRLVENIIDNEEITIVHTHHRMSALYTAMLKRKKAFAFINTSHNTFYNNKILTRFAYKNANLIACGEMVKKNLIEYYKLPEKQIKVIHNAVKPYEEEYVEEPALSELKKKGFVLVGNIGRITEQKGMVYFVDSLPEVLRKCPNVKYVIVGSGEDEVQLKEHVAEIDVEDAVFFMGYKKDIQNVISQLDFIVLSSLWEGLPLTPIEAFSVGKTVIGTAVDGTVEIIKDGYNGYLIEPKNSKQIADRVIKLVKNPSILGAMSEAGERTYNSEFNFEQFSDKVLNYYREL